MNVLASPEFSSKTRTLPQETLVHLSSFVKEAESQIKADLIKSDKYKLSLLDKDIYIARLGSGRLYLTFDKNNEGEYLLLLDYVSRQTTPSNNTQFFSPSNPKTNRSLNPKYNRSINPKYNRAINPKYNRAINPKYNRAINPKYNRAINPKYNRAINPKYNRAINPKYNRAINPKYNSSLNPRLNRSYGGPYLYDKNLKQMAYLVKSNDSYEIIFSLEGEQLFYLIKVNDSIRVEFDRDGCWTGYYLKANDRVSLRYSADSEWTDILID